MLPAETYVHIHTKWQRLAWRSRADCWRHGGGGGGGGWGGDGGRDLSVLNWGPPGWFNKPTRLLRTKFKATKFEGAARGWRVTRLKPTPREWMSMTSVSQSDPKGWLTGLWDRQDTWHSLGKDFISPYLAVQIGLLCIFWLGFKVCYMPANLLQQRRRTTHCVLPSASLETDA